MRIFINAWNGGNASGACGNGLPYEYDAGTGIYVFEWGEHSEIIITISAEGFYTATIYGIWE